MIKVFKIIGNLLLLRWIYNRLKPWQWICVLGVAVLYASVAYIPYVHTFVNTFAQAMHSKFVVKTGLQVQHLLIEGRKHANRQQVVDAIGLRSAQTPILSVDVWAIQQRLEHLGWVKDVGVSRIFPDTLYVHINERIPTVILQRQGVFTLMDRDGVRISQDNIANFSHLKVLIGEGVEYQVPTFMDLIQSDTSLEQIVQAGVYVSKRRWDIILQGGIRVKMPADNPEKAWVLLGRLVREKDLLARPITAIDLRIDGRVNLQMKQQDEDKPT